MKIKLLIIKGTNYLLTEKKRTKLNFLNKIRSCQLFSTFFHIDFLSFKILYFLKK